MIVVLVLIPSFPDRFKSIPSIVELDGLTVRGDLWFGEGVTFEGPFGWRFCWVKMSIGKLNLCLIQSF